MRNSARLARRRQRGQGLLEYSIVLSLIAMIVVGVVQRVGHLTYVADCKAAVGLGAAIAPPTAAAEVYGQGGSFTTSDFNHSGLSASSLYYPLGVTPDASDNFLYVADEWNNRVLYYQAGSKTATRVYGQSGSFATNAQNNGGVSANSLYKPFHVAFDNSGLYVADTWNHRVLYYPAGSTTATRVYGQAGSFATNDAYHGGVNNDSMSYPSTVTLDSSGGLYIAGGGARVLYYAAGSATATRVYGQADFVSNLANRGGAPSANTLSSVSGAALDGSGNLYVGDTGNNRVLYYPAGSTTATRVYGQADFVSSLANRGGAPSANTLNGPTRLSADNAGNLYVADELNSRVLYYPSGSTTATQVYGQGGSFTSNDINHGGLSASSLYQPSGVAATMSGLYIGDLYNHRVLYYPTCQ